MARAAFTGLPGNRRPRPRHETPTATDLAERMFTREAPNRLWVIDITEHRTYEGKVYCAVLLETFSRLVVGWSIDTSQTAALVTKTLGMAIVNRDPQAGGIIRSDHGVHGGFNYSMQHLDFRRCAMGYGKRQLEVRGYRGQIPLPGRPVASPEN